MLIKGMNRVYLRCFLRVTKLSVIIFQSRRLMHNLLDKNKKSKKKILKKNMLLKNRHAGERCFILGNGPSLKEVEFGSLADEFVFSVNQLTMHKDYEALQSNVHFWSSDEGFYSDAINQDVKSVVNSMQVIESLTQKPVVFFPIERMGFLEEHNIAKKAEIYFYQTGVHFEDSGFGGYDFTKAVNDYATVVHKCIVLATYMGFSEIYLLGCDATSVMVSLKALLNKSDQDDYVYQLNDEEKKRMNRSKRKISVIFILEESMRLFAGYEVLNRYCRKRGIKLVNCSSETLVDSVERMPLNDVLIK